MTTMARSRLAMFGVVLLLAFALPVRAQGMRTIFLVRHANRASDAPDAPLNLQGQRRAECLATMLRDAHIEKIYTSDLQRTRQTAAPLAQRLRLQPVAVPSVKPAELVDAIRSDPAANILVVWHADSLPGILRSLGGPEIASIGRDEYDQLFILTLDSNAKDSPPGFIVLRYCDSAK